MEVKRYDIYGKLEEHSEGALVLHNDYLTLQAERDLLRQFKKDFIYHAFHERWDMVKELLRGEIPL